MDPVLLLLEDRPAVRAGWRQMHANKPVQKNVKRLSRTHTGLSPGERVADMVSSHPRGRCRVGLLSAG